MTCGETFLPSHPTEPHHVREDDTECGGAPTDIRLFKTEHTLCPICMRLLAEHTTWCVED